MSGYRHKYITTMTMQILERTDKGFKCMTHDPKGKGKVRTGKVEFFQKQDIEGDKALFVKEESPSFYWVPEVVLTFPK